MKPLKHYKNSISPIWIIPFVAIIIAIFMIFSYYSKEGTTITLYLNNASGIVAGKTKIEVKNVQIGTISSVNLSKNLHFIVAKAKINENADRMLSSGSIFWVVSPELNYKGISGVSTLLSGSYIEMNPELISSANKKQTTFKVLESAPTVMSAGVKPIKVVLSYPTANLLKVGAPIEYKGLIVGYIYKDNILSRNGNFLYYGLVEKSYSKFLNSSTAFWLNSSFSLNFNNKGVSLNVKSLPQLILGSGVSFGDNEKIKPIYTINSSKVFKIYNARSLAMQTVINTNYPYIIFFKSFKHLSKGSLVYLNGLPIGVVGNISYKLDNSFVENGDPALIYIEPSLLYPNDKKKQIQFINYLYTIIKEGRVEATLSTVNLLTNQQVIKLTYNNNGHDIFTKYKGYPVIPSYLSGFEAIEDYSSKFMKSINTAGIPKLIKNLDTLTVTANKAVKNVSLSLTNDLQSFAPGSEMYSNISTAVQGLTNLENQLSPIFNELNVKSNSLLFAQVKVQDPKI
ncbi:MAG: MlaD family protein [Psittacicella sp.]